jgi:hypothetical protein
MGAGAEEFESDRARGYLGQEEKESAVAVQEKWPGIACGIFPASAPQSNSM